MADKLTLPKTKFAHDLAAGPVDPTMKEAHATTSKLYRVPVDAIKPIPGFNVRVHSPEYEAHKENLKALIKANGFDQTKPLAGYVAKEGDENVIYVTDGHTRLDAVNEINEDSEDKIATLPIIIRSPAPSLTDLTVALHTNNSGRPLTPFEMGVVVKRLLAEEGAKKPDIAARLGVSERYLSDVLLLANADKKVKQHVAAGAVSSTMAIQLLRKDEDSAAEKIEAAISKTAGTGKKATKKHTGPKTQKVNATVTFEEGDDIKEVVKSAAAAIRDAVAVEEGEEGVKLTTAGGSVTLTIELPVVEEETPAPAKKPAKTKAAPAKKAKTEPAEEDAPAPKKAKVKDAPSPVKDKTVTSKAKKAAPAKGKAKKSKGDDLGIPGAVPVEEDDSEIAKLPPKTKSDANVPDEEEVDI
jgi:hypothetical protein